MPEKWIPNEGYLARRIKNSKPFELYGRLHTDICFQNRYIINNVDMVIRLIRNPHSFCLMGDGKHNYEIFIEEATLYMRQVKISPAFMLQHAMALEKATIKYPLTRVHNTTMLYYASTNNALFSFDLSPDKCFGDHFNVIKKGNLRIKLSFREAVSTVLTLFVYMEYDNMMEITKNRNVIFDYTV